MRSAAFVILLGGCSQIFGLDEPTRVVDASADDAPADVAADAAPPPSLIDIITQQNQTASLLIALDAGDEASYTGTTQTWTNLAAGTGTSFMVGLTSAVDAADPTFHGTPGARSEQEYFTFDGGDVFVETTAGWGDDAFAQDGGKVSILAVLSSPAGFAMFANSRFNESGVSAPGVVFARVSTKKQIWYQEGDSNMGYSTTSAANVTLDAWSFSAVSVDANGGTSDVHHVFDATVEDYLDEPELYTTMAADRPASIAGAANATGGAPMGSRLAMFALWSRALTTNELTQLRLAIKAARFPSLP